MQPRQRRACSRRSAAKSKQQQCQEPQRRRQRRNKPAVRGAISRPARVRNHSTTRRKQRIHECTLALWNSSDDTSNGLVAGIFFQGENSNGPTEEAASLKGKGKALLLNDATKQQQQQQLVSNGGLKKHKNKAAEFNNVDHDGQDEESSGVACGICLTDGVYKGGERGKLDCCDHVFCSGCILEWSKVESKCPACKQRFLTILRCTHPDQPASRGRTIHVPLRDQVYEPSEEEIRGVTDPYENIVCAECHETGDEALLLLCDFCDTASHTYCVGLGFSVPRGDWFCQCCRSSILEQQASPNAASVDNDAATPTIDEDGALAHEPPGDALHVHS